MYSSIVFLADDLYEGDIKLTKEQQDILQGKDGGNAFNVIKTSIWPLTIPYDLAPEIGKKILFYTF